jgi:hypothetical protein
MQNDITFVNEKLDKTYEENMEVIQKNHPELSKMLNKARDPKDRLQINANNEINISINKQKIYPNSKIEENIQQQIANFIKKPIAITAKPTNPQNTIDKTRHASIYFNSLKSILNKSPQFDGENVHHESYKFHENIVPLIIVFGLGNGRHIEYLLDKMNIKNLIIVEHSVEIIKTSLYCANWTNILDKVNKKNINIQFVYKKDELSAVQEIMRLSYRVNPVFVSNTLLYFHYRSRFFTNIHNELKNKIHLIFKSWGFYDDEYATISQTLRNERCKYPVLKNVASTFVNAPVFLIANGPSLDQSINILKQYQKCAILISCGTAIGSLYRSGIQPDFHLEIERGYKKTEALACDVPRSFLKNIPIIGPTRIHPATLSLSDNPLMYIKGGDAGGALYPDSCFRLPLANPTVANGALALSISLGFKNIYLFGMDMGKKEFDFHHSSNSIYALSDIFNATNKSYNIPLAGNHNDTIYSEPILHWSKSNLEFLLRSNNHITCYNMSNGAYIEGTTPLSPDDDTNFDFAFIDKIYILKCIFDKFEYNSCSDISNTRLQQKVRNMSFVCNNLLSILDINIYTLNDFVELCSSIQDYMLNHVSCFDECVFYLLKGSLLHIQLLLFTHSFSCSDHGVAIQFLNKGLAFLKDFINNSYYEFESLIYQKGIAVN